ncbi:hypothetical protein BX600DRAFT_221498 [Xylariales sp. PMI_506]|nr:hypothetical protein BX600DRAFT_221498 [Xylariales sp. PMI_506]
MIFVVLLRVINQGNEYLHPSTLHILLCFLLLYGVDFLSFAIRAVGFGVQGPREHLGSYDRLRVWYILSSSVHTQVLRTWKKKLVGIYGLRALYFEWTLGMSRWIPSCKSSQQFRHSSIKHFYRRHHRGLMEEYSKIELIISPNPHDFQSQLFPHADPARYGEKNRCT